MAADITGRILSKGDWVYDTTGVYEVVETDVGDGNLTYFKEVVFIEDMDDEFEYGDERILTRKEVAKLGMF